MSVRFKLLAAVLGLAVAAGACAEASAKTISKTITKPVASHAATSKAISHKIAGKSHRLHVAHRALKTTKVAPGFGKKLVSLKKTHGQKVASIHHTKTTIVR